MNQIDYLTGYPPGDFSFFNLKLHLIYSSLLNQKKYKILEKYFSLFSSFYYPKYVKEYSKYINLKCRSRKYIPTILSGLDNTRGITSGLPF